MSLDDVTVPFTLRLAESTVDKGLLGFFNSDPDPTSVVENGEQKITSTGIASVYLNDFVFMEIDQFDDKVTVANKTDKYTYVIQNSSDKLDNLVFYDEQTTTVREEFNSLTIKIYDETHTLLELYNDYSFVLEIEYCP